ncbi:unnamed protein product [Urochloa humidicola]
MAGNKAAPAALPAALHWPQKGCCLVTLTSSETVAEPPVWRALAAAIPVADDPPPPPGGAGGSSLRVLVRFCPFAAAEV